MATGKHVLPQELASAPPSVDLDLDLDFSIGDDMADAPVVNLVKPPTPMQIEPTVAFTAAPLEPPALDMDFGSGTVALAPTAMPDLPAISTDIDEPVRLSAPDLTLSENDLSFSPEALSPPAPTPPADSGMIEFDLMGALSPDLDPPAVAPPLPVVNGDDTAGAPLDTGSSAISTGFDDMGADPLAAKARAGRGVQRHWRPRRCAQPRRGSHGLKPRDRSRPGRSASWRNWPEPFDRFPLPWW